MSKMEEKKAETTHESSKKTETTQESSKKTETTLENSTIALVNYSGTLKAFKTNERNEPLANGEVEIKNLQGLSEEKIEKMFQEDTKTHKPASVSYKLQYENGKLKSIQTMANGLPVGVLDVK
ncbi:MAG: hypothetical protein ACTSXL_05995 [Alphaproteobacteria bacterium]